MDSTDYKNILLLAYMDEELTAKDFINTLEYYAELYHQEQLVKDS